MPRRSRTGAAALVLALALTSGCTGQQAGGPTPAASAPASSTPAGSLPTPAPAALSWSPCERGFECATLRVPQADPGLAVTRRRATGARIGSLVVNPGGPGVSAVDSLQASAGSLPPLLRDRFDLVAVDPRGVGRSGAVRCATTADLDRYLALDPSPDTPAELTALEQGSRALAQGCAERSGPLLSQVSTRRAAEDLDVLRAALGDEQLTYLGYSYGTAIGAAYLAAYPTRVRAMVLDGALDPTLTWDALLGDQGRGFDRALEALLADCERTRCAFRGVVSGDLAAAYDALAARVEQTPLPGSAGRLLGPGELSLGVGQGLYSRTYGWPAVAEALAAAQGGDGGPLLALSDAYLDRTPAGYAPVTESNLAVTCVDRPWPRETQAYLDLAAVLARDAPRFGPAIALSGLPCASWPTPPVSVPALVPGAGGPPVVVIGTTNDPATPYAWSVALAGQLDRGVLLTHVGDGHTVYRVGAPACITEPVGDYLVTGRAPAPARC
ncbi:MAG TPA: alpha/beta hydrolase [Mycobacteriales bacterium]|nr:alpha/beta hydrolase [Mycobacteriales bacterium]